MMKLKIMAAALAVVAAPAFSDVERVLNEHILPGYAALAARTGALAQAAQADCAPDSVAPAFHSAYDAWISISHIQFGPVEDLGITLKMAYWPDPKNRTGKALNRLRSARDPVVNDPAAFKEVSVAAQGFTVLERILFAPRKFAGYDCALTRAVTGELARNAAALDAAWPEFAALMQAAGAEGNTRFQSQAEVQRALFTALSTGLEFLHDQRLGRPLGTFDKPRPNRAEARKSERALRHIALSLAALEDLALRLHDGDLTRTKASFAEAKERAAAIDDPALAGVAEPIKRIRIEALQRAVQDIRGAVSAEIGQPLGISAGFNALDGD
ncbi:MAG: imelysin family protein [Pseudomonadota bacterium]